MKKHIKIILSIVIACALLLAVAIPSFAESYNFNLISPPYLTKDNVDAYEFVEKFTPLFESMVIGEKIYFDTNVAEIPRVYLLRFDDSTLNVGFTIVQPDAEPFDIAVNGFDFDEALVIKGFADLSTLNLDIDVSVPSRYVELLRAFFPSSVDIHDIYEGNAFLDIMNSIIEALDVNIFGNFSLWDMLTTICGLCAVVWLLKLLAGG